MACVGSSPEGRLRADPWYRRRVAPAVAAVVLWWAAATVPLTVETPPSLAFVQSVPVGVSLKERLNLDPWSGNE